MDNNSKILILGTGSTSVQIAVNLGKDLSCDIGIVGRPSENGKKFKQDLLRNSSNVSVEVQNNKHKSMSGEYRISQFFLGYENIIGEWDTLILTISNDAYLNVLSRISNNVLQSVKHIILISPVLGSSNLIHSYLKDKNLEAEIISFSTYYAATKRVNKDSSFTKVLTKGRKKKLWLGSSSENSNTTKYLSRLLQKNGIETVIMANPNGAESRNVSLYVHPPILINEFSLNVIFGNEEGQKYMYKLYPEGPFTQFLIKNLLAMWKEITSVLKAIGIEEFNLLKFLNDDNYPVREESISRHDVENFMDFNITKQEYLLYVRYTSLLIDPFSTPDLEGKYFDFSAVKYQKVFKSDNGYWQIPRMPKEDFYRLRVIKGIANMFNIPTTVIDEILNLYEIKCSNFKLENKMDKFSDDFSTKRVEEDIVTICHDLKQKDGVKC